MAPTTRSLLRLALAALMLAWGTAPAAAWWNGDWPYRKPVALEPAAAGVTAPADRALLLVRLHAGNFDFLAAKEDGSDLRVVAGDDATPLTFHIEKWDNLFEQGLVWVDLPAAQLAAPAPAIFLYFGNEAAESLGDAEASYPASRTLVWHFQPQGPLPQDSTAYGNAATASTALPGPAYVGDGIVLGAPDAAVTLPASPSLAVAAGGAWSMQAWIQPSEARPNALILALDGAAGGPGGLRIGLDGTTPFVELDGPAGVQRIAGGAAVTPGAWHQIAVTAGRQLTLYLDGRPIGSAPASLPALAGSGRLGAPAAPAALETPAVPEAPGAPPPAAAAGTQAAAPPSAVAAAPADGAPVPAPFVGFAGSLDELRLANVELGAADILFAQAAEVAESRLTVYGQDEEGHGFDLGHFGPIVRNVTTDGWVVIALCGVLLVLSWWVMIAKTAWINGVSAANQSFLRSFRALASNILALDHQPEGRTAKELAAARRQRSSFARSPLYKLYHAGAAEVEKRVNGHADGAAPAAEAPTAPAAAGRTVMPPMVPARAAPAPATPAPVATALPVTLSAQAIASIRAVLDAVLVRELQRANRYMVLLTIAISGGPFLGLLGTVVGVMITFAAIAESGQVNVNAIAPGIAAALLATVAGLAVAIPALFGYNYLVGRIKDVSNDMQVFVDEFTTRIAEQYSR